MDRSETDKARPEPLDLPTWIEAIRGALPFLLEEPDETVVSRALRKAFHLSRLTPDPIRSLFATQSDEGTYEHLLQSGDLEGAARALLTPALSIESSKPDGKFVVCIQASGIDSRGTGASSHPAAAILAAWFSCISSALAHAAEDGGALSQDRRISPHVPHQSSSLH